MWYNQFIGGVFMRKDENEQMNYDENGYYPDEKKQDTNENEPILFDKIFGKIIIVWFFVTIFLIYKLAGTPNGGYKALIMFIQLFAVFGIAGMISDGIKKRKLMIPWLVVTACSVAGMIAVYAYQIGSEDLRHFLRRLGLFLFFMLFIVIGLGVVITSIRGSRGNPQRCTFAVTATCVKASTSTETANGGVIVYYNPTYEYTYEGETYKSTVLNVSQLRESGMSYDIFIDPDKPKRVYDPDSVKSYLFPVLFGALFVAMPLIMMILIFKFADI